jgi:molybdopterin-binding protein
MNKNYFSIILICALITVIPIASAQLSFGGEAYQKSIEVIVDKSEIVKAKHVIGSSNNPVNIELFEGVIVESIKVTNEKDEKLEFGTSGSGESVSLTIFPSKSNIIIKYNLEDVVRLSDNMWILDIGYPKTFSIIFPEKTELIFLNNNLIQLGDKKGVSVNNGSDVMIQYYDKISKIIEEVRWEENKFDVEIITDSKINKFDFEQASKSISFQVNEKNKFVTISMEKELLGGPYVILLNDEKIMYSNYPDGENRILISMKPESTGEIIIIGTTVIPEFSMFIPLVFGFMIILTLPLMRKFSLH